MTAPRLIVYSSLFPSDAAPTAGTFIRERMFRVARRVPLVVVAPQAWSPFDALIRLFRPGFRPMASRRETMDGIEVHRPYWLSLPGIGKRFDGWLMALCTEACVRGIHRHFRATAIDAHFLYPDGWAAARIAQRLGLPVTITIRGSKDEWLIGTSREARLREAMARATKLFAVSQALARNVAYALGTAPSKVEVIGNGVDAERFAPVDRAAARRRLGLPLDAPVLIGVGNLIPSKGFQRVVPLLPRLRERHPGLVYLIVGAGASQGDLRASLEAQARECGVADAVRFCGRQPQDELRWFYGAADVFVLATEFEGWANVFLEAMACGLPVVTTRVGGNAEVVREPDTGELVDWWDPTAFADAIDRALVRRWDREAIIAYARTHGWDRRVEQLVAEFTRLGTSARTDASVVAVP
ncbi:MAG TPA: glycosyltransferase [Zeimonas sp.]|nr:glycosyltransferase [Zeimonas sp.]